MSVTGLVCEMMCFVFFFANLFYEFVALLQFEGSVLQGGARSVMDLQPLLIRRLADVGHREAQSTQPWKRETAAQHTQSSGVICNYFLFQNLDVLIRLDHSNCIVFTSYDQISWKFLLTNSNIKIFLLLSK